MEDVLDALTITVKDYEQFAIASKNKRIINYLIDTIVYYAVCLIMGIVLAVVLIPIGLEDELDQWTNSDDPLTDWFISIIIMIVYYIILEYIFNGKTVGKFVTRTRAVSLDNTRMDLTTVAVRSMSRVVPFDALSFLGNGIGWHDKWSETRVIDEKTYQHQRHF